MKHACYVFIIIFLSFYLVACGPAADTGLPPVDAPPSDGGGSEPDSGFPPSNGGEITPPKLPAQSFATTSNGYVTMTKIDSYVVTDSPDLIGATENSTGLFLLFERSAGSSIKMWDIYKISGSQSPLRVCSISRPGSTYDRYSGFVFDGSLFRIYGENSGYPSWTRLYTFNLSTCTMGPYKTITSSAVYTGTPILSSYTNKFYYTYGSQIRTWDESTGLVTNWSYSTSSISGITPYPVQSTYSVFNDGSVWFMDNNRRLWQGNQSGQWLGLAEFPYSNYSDLYYSKFIVQSGSGLNVITYNKYGESMMIYHLDVSNF